MRSKGIGITFGILMALGMIVTVSAITVVVSGVQLAGGQLSDSSQEGDVNKLASALEKQCQGHTTVGEPPDTKTLNLEFVSIKKLGMEDNTISADFEGGGATSVDLDYCDYTMKDPNPVTKERSTIWKFTIESSYDPDTDPTNSPSNDPPQVTVKPQVTQ